MILKGGMTTQNAVLCFVADIIVLRRDRSHDTELFVDNCGILANKILLFSTRVPGWTYSWSLSMWSLHVLTMYSMHGFSLGSPASSHNAKLTLVFVVCVRMDCSLSRLSL